MRRRRYCRWLSLSESHWCSSASQAAKLFRFGRGDFLSLLDAQRSLASAEVTAASARAQLVQDQIALFLALGGGWGSGDGVDEGAGDAH